MGRQRPLLRATAELLNAANGVRPLGRDGYITLPVFGFGWPTTEMSPLYLVASVLDAVRRGLRGEFRGARGRVALLLTAIAWALLWLIHRRNTTSRPNFEEPLREALGDDYESIAAQASIKESIADYGGDPDFVAISGGSAGGHLCALAALTPNDRQRQPGFEDVDTSVVAAVPIYGRYDWFTARGPGRREFIAFLQKFVVKKRFLQNKRVYVDASPIKAVTGRRTTVFHSARPGRLNHSVPEGREFAEAMWNTSKSVVAYAEIPHAQHAFDFYYGSRRGHYTAQAVEEFLSWVHAKRAQASSQQTA